MTRDDVFRLAQEIWPSNRRMWAYDCELPKLERFAAEVEANEARPVDDRIYQMQKRVEEIEFIAKAIRALERETCAQLCDEAAKWPSLTPKNCAESIRGQI